jgi:surface protein
MKQIIKIIIIITFLNCFNGFSQNNPNFYLADNGVTCMCPNAEFGDTGTLTINGEIKTFTKRTNDQLKALINSNIYNPEISLTCTSGITDMGAMFHRTNGFNQDIGNWDVSNVLNMERMFDLAGFNKDISAWNTSSVKRMDLMFSNSGFNQDIGNWDVSSVTNMRGMFKQSIYFNQDISYWDVSNVTNMDEMFSIRTPWNGLFNQDISYWCVDKIPSQPTNFSNNSALEDNFKPNWGNCYYKNPDFYLASNGTTCMCSNAVVGELGTIVINGVKKNFT